MKNLQLLQSHEDRYSYPLENKYPKYSLDMYTLLQFSKGIFEILGENYNDYDEYCYIHVDFSEGYYRVYDEGRESVLPRQLLKKIDLEYFFNLSTAYDLYLHLKLLYDNDFRLS